MKHQLTHEQRLTWKMTQKMSQAIEILTFNGLELVEFLEEQAVENPLIHFSKPSSGTAIPHTIQQEKTIYQHLKDQLLHLSITSSMKEVVEYGIDSLNEHGYLDISTEEWAQACSIQDSEVLNALRFLQSLEPAGIGARDLQECIQLQLDRSGAPAFVQDLTANHLEWVADRDLAEIIDFYQITEEAANSAITLIQSCHPRPALQLAPVQKDYVIPDAEVTFHNGKWKCELSEWNKPRLEWDQELMNIASENEETKQFIQEKYNHAQWMIDAIQVRKENFQQVLTHIVQKQQDFFEKGPSYVQPLRMREIAEPVNVNVSTISRLVKHKYIQTPHGLVPLKFFFQQGVRTNTGKETSSHSIKQLMKETIQGEDKFAPFSDQKLSEQLQKQFGIHISRRTVAKYRESLHIPTASKRKKKRSPIQ